jgi:hypothetical protein
VEELDKFKEFKARERRESGGGVREDKETVGANRS